MTVNCWRISKVSMFRIDGMNKIAVSDCSERYLRLPIQFIHRILVTRLENVCPPFRVFDLTIIVWSAFNVGYTVAFPLVQHNTTPIQDESSNQEYASAIVIKFYHCQLKLQAETLNQKPTVTFLLRQLQRSVSIQQNSSPFDLFKRLSTVSQDLTMTYYRINNYSIILLFNTVYGIQFRTSTGIKVNFAHVFQMFSFDQQEVLNRSACLFLYEVTLQEFYSQLNRFSLSARMKDIDAFTFQQYF